ncbi:hypothetical protein [Kribbella sp. DT2]|uniref:hypothetical protein n=1 Tax=Kribbella sp. DT2 TaxID=3393427 RepID=UPI003CEC32C6
MMLETCAICGLMAVDRFIRNQRIGGRLLTPQETQLDDGDRSVGFCVEHEREVMTLMLDSGWMPNPWTADDEAAERRYLRDREARRKVADEEAEKRSATSAEALYQQQLPDHRRRFERGLTKRTRVAAARWLGENCLQRDPELAGTAYAYIADARPPKDRDGLFELATGLRVGDRFEAAERVYRRLLDDNPDDEDALFGLISVLRSLGRAEEADAKARRHWRIKELCDLLEQAMVTAKQYHASDRVARIAPAVVDLLELDEDPRRALWSTSLPIPRGVGFAVRTDRRLLIVEDYEYLDSGTQRRRTPEHLIRDLGSDWDQQYFPQ